MTQMTTNDNNGNTFVTMIMTNNTNDYDNKSQQMTMTGCSQQMTMTTNDRRASCQGQTTPQSCGLPLPM